MRKRKRVKLPLFLWRAKVPLHLTLSCPITFPTLSMRKRKRVKLPLFLWRAKVPLHLTLSCPITFPTFKHGKARKVNGVTQFLPSLLQVPLDMTNFNRLSRILNLRKQSGDWSCVSGFANANGCKAMVVRLVLVFRCVAKALLEATRVCLRVIS